MNPDIFTETFCDWIIIYLLYLYVFEILLKSEEVRQSSSKIYDWKEEGRWNSRSSQRPRTSDAGNVPEHTIPVFAVGASFFRPPYVSAYQDNSLSVLNDSVIQTFSTFSQVYSNKEELGQFSIEAPKCSALQFFGFYQ